MERLRYGNVVVIVHLQSGGTKYALHVHFLNRLQLFALTYPFMEVNHGSPYVDL